MDLIRQRANAVLLIVGAYSLLNLGFMLIRVPPVGTAGVPIGECVILLFALTFVFELHRVPGFVRVAPVLPLAIWWLVGSVQVADGFLRHGFWALRDATHLIETLYLWIGFVVAASPMFFDRFSRWLRALLNIGAVYSLLYPFRDTLIAYSPKLQAPGGYQASILFNFMSGTILPFTAAMYWMVDRVRVFGIPAVALAGAIIVYTIAVYQMRTAYLQVIALATILMVVQPRVAMRLSGSLGLGALGLVVILAFGVEITGRLGEKFTLDFFLQHFAAIWGETGDGAVASAAGGVSERLEWWARIWDRLNETVTNLLFGLGYGIPLTDHVGPEGNVTREPHNSVISTLARTGLVGVSAMIALHIALIIRWIRVYRWVKAAGDKVWTNNMVILLVFFVMTWVYAIGEDTFEKPFATIPFYFIWGVILRAEYAIRTGTWQVVDDRREVAAHPQVLKPA